MSKLHTFEGVNNVKIYIDFEKDVTAALVPETPGADGKILPKRFIYNGKVDIMGSDLDKMKEAFLSNYKEIV